MLFSQCQINERTARFPLCIFRLDNLKKKSKLESKVISNLITF